MPLRVALLLVIVLGVLVAYLTSLNASGVRMVLGPGWISDVPLMVLIVGAFIIGATLARLFGTVRDFRRSYRDYQRARRAGPAEALSENHGPETSLAARRAPAYGAGHAAVPTRSGELAEGRGETHGTLGHHPRSEERMESLLALAGECRLQGRVDDAVDAYRRVLAHDHDHVGALRGVRDVTTEHGRFIEALPAQERLVRVASREERVLEETALAGIHYELGRVLLAGGQTSGAVARFREALRARPDFLPATLVLGDALLKLGDTREALRVWERALESHPASPLLSRIEHLYRADGRPARMIALYEEAAARHPDNQAIAFGLGRVYFGLAMLDEAAEQFEKLEVRAPDLPSIHAYLGAIFERRGQVREALEEYRRALGFPAAIEWPHRCVACGAVEPAWVARCSACHAWNTSRP